MPHQKTGTKKPPNSDNHGPYRESVERRAKPFHTSLRVTATHTQGVRHAGIAHEIRHVTSTRENAFRMLKAYMRETRMEPKNFSNEILARAPAVGGAAEGVSVSPNLVGNGLAFTL